MGAKHIGGRKGETLYHLVAALREIIRDGRIVVVEGPKKTGSAIEAVYKIGARVVLKGKPRDVIVAVRETADGRYHYDLSRDVSGGARFQRTETTNSASAAGVEDDPAAGLNIEIAPEAGNGFAETSSRFQRARLPSRQARAHMATAMGGRHAFVPDRRIWEELTRANAGVWARLRGGAAAAKDQVDRARIIFQDRFLPILRAQEAVMRGTGQPLPLEQNAYIAETTFSGKVGRHLFEIDEDYTKPIIDLIAEAKGALTADYVGTWLIARHTQERNAHIASINPAMPDGGSGMTDAEASLILAEAAAGPYAARLKPVQLSRTTSVSYPQGTKELYALDLKERRLAWLQHKFGVLLD